jgi:hypothetical protein
MRRDCSNPSMKEPHAFAIGDAVQRSMRVDSTGVRSAKHSDNVHRTPFLLSSVIVGSRAYAEFNICRRYTQLRPAYANCLDSLLYRDMTLLGGVDRRAVCGSRHRSLEVKSRRYPSQEKLPAAFSSNPVGHRVLFYPTQSTADGPSVYVPMFLFTVKQMRSARMPVRFQDAQNVVPHPSDSLRCWNVIPGSMNDSGVRLSRNFNT